MSAKEAYEHPAFKYIKYSKAWDVARKVEKAILEYVLEGRFEFTPRRFHNTELIACPVRSGYERFIKHAPHEFKDVNVLFIGETVHQKMATLIPNTIAEEAFSEEELDPDLVTRLQEREFPIGLSFHVDVHRPEISPGTSTVYEIKTKERYGGLYDKNLLKHITIENHQEINVTPTSTYLNQLIPYQVITKSNQGSLIYIPKLLHRDIIAYEVFFPHTEAKRHVQETLVQRAEVLADVMRRLEEKEELDFSVIEPSGICRRYCQFGRPDTTWEVPEKNIKQKCPAYLLPTPTKITKHASPELQNFYRILAEAVQAKFEAEGLNFFSDFQFASIKRPELITLTGEEIQQATGGIDKDVAEAYLHKLDSWRYTKFRVVNGKDVVEVVPIRKMVRRGWSKYIFAPYFPNVREAKAAADTLQEAMVEVVSEFIWQPYNYKGLYGCPRLQHFANRGEAKKGLVANPNMAKLWFIDMAIYENLTQTCCDPTPESIKFGKYTFNYFRLYEEFSQDKRAILWIPIYRTEWREIVKPRRMPKAKSVVITPLKRHVLQAATLSILLGIKKEVQHLTSRSKSPLSKQEARKKVKEQIAAGKYPPPESVFLGYYPRKKHGDIRVYEVLAEDPAAVIALGQEFMKAISESIPIAGKYREEVDRIIQGLMEEEGISQGEATLIVKKKVSDREILPVFTCRWCPMRPWCKEGRDLLNFLDLTLEEAKSGVGLRTF